MKTVDLLCHYISSIGPHHDKFVVLDDLPGNSTATDNRGIHFRVRTSSSAPLGAKVKFQVSMQSDRKFTSRVPQHVSHPDKYCLSLKLRGHTPASILRTTAYRFLHKECTLRKCPR